MSQENVALVRQSFDAWNEGGPEAAKQFWARTSSGTISQAFPTGGWCGAGMQSSPI
jgi:hypothetical protein